MKREFLECRNRRRPTLVLAGVLACSFLPVSGAAQDTDELDDHLRFLEPLIGPQWEGGYVEGDGAGLVISLRFEPALSGRAVKYTREAAELGYVGETHFYWSPSQQEVRFLALNSRGSLGEGVASMQEGAIVLEGVDQRPDGTTIESRTVWEFVEGGVLRDTYTGRENGESVPGHVQEFRARERLP